MIKLPYHIFKSWRITTEIYGTTSFLRNFSAALAASANSTFGSGYF